MARAATGRKAGGRSRNLATQSAAALPGGIDDESERFPKNAPGPFYTLGYRDSYGNWCGACLWCGAPEAEAPDLLAPLGDDNTDTYFVRQPQSPEEIERACRAIGVCCAEALRYGGTDPAIIRRLGNDPAFCDYLLDDAGRPYPAPGGLASHQTPDDQTPDHRSP
jgi:hypothetical protein